MAFRGSEKNALVSRPRSDWGLSPLHSRGSRRDAIDLRQTRQPAGGATPTIALDETESAPYLALTGEALGQNAAGR
jgi:hypothetical protein